MNAGLIVGFVYVNGRPLSKADVWMVEMRGMANYQQIGINGESNLLSKYPAAKTNSRGFFKLPFHWSGADIGETVGTNGQVDITMVAQQDVSSGRNRSHTYASRMYIKGVLVKDINRLLAAGGIETEIPEQPENISDFVSLGKDLLESYAEERTRPFFRQALLSSESWLIVSAVKFYINN